MPESAELGADDLVLADLRGGEVQRYIQPRYEIFLHAQFANIKRMPNVFRMQTQSNRSIHRHHERTDHDVIACRNVVRRVEPEVISAPVVDFVGMGPAEL